MNVLSQNCTGEESHTATSLSVHRVRVTRISDNVIY